MTIIDFIPSATAPFQFSPTLDGQVCSARVVWNFFGQRYYLEVSSLNGTLIVALPMVGSPIGFRLSSLSWAHGIVTAVTQEPHGFKVGSTMDLTISGVAPVAFNGLLRVLVKTATTFTYKLVSDPGPPTRYGRVDYNINLVGGYFEESTLVFREANQQFEISP